MTMNESQLAEYCEKHGLNDRQTKYISRMRADSPVRPVKASRSHGAVIHTSTKMRRTIACESRNLEHFHIIVHNTDPDTFEIHGQPDIARIENKKPAYKEYSCLFKYHRAVMIEGGRGSGKTMFIKYHCHQTRFSQKREKISSDELKHVGLYFRPDTDFCAMINSYNFEKSWEQVFKHYILINIIQDFISAINIISKTVFEDISFENDLLDIKTPMSLRKAITGFPGTYRGLEGFYKEMIAEFNLWINDVESFPKPRLLEPRTVIQQLIEGLVETSDEMRYLCFYVYFDEFENLSADQQRIINSWMKHGQSPLIFNAAYKKGAKVNRETSSSERLVQRNDYRVVNLDKLSPTEFKVFAAEVFSLKLMEAVKLEEYELLRKYFCDEKHIEHRKSDHHQEVVLNVARKFLPSLSYKKIAEGIIGDGKLRKRIEKFLIAPALVKNQKFSPKDFIDIKYPEESIINGLLLSRKNYTPEKVFELFKNHRSNTTKGVYKSLVEQNLVGAILWVYLSASWKKCPAYAGFDRFCLLARGNMRHFLELCHQTLSIAARNSMSISGGNVIPMPIDTQSEAASTSSRLELEKVDELGQHGEKLRFIANRLGLFFQLLQKRKSQSETEVNHFSIKIADTNLLDETTKTLLEEAVLWSVLIEIEGDTKRKGSTEISSKEFMLHPIYSPHFGISYRRKKKFAFSEGQIKTIFSGSESEYVKLRSEFAKKWDLSVENLPDTESIMSTDFVQRGLWDC